MYTMNRLNYLKFIIKWTLYVHVFIHFLIFQWSSFSNKMDNTSTHLDLQSDSGSASSAFLTPFISEKKNDWCRWPICENFRQSGSCPHGTMCLLAHVPQKASGSTPSNGYVRVCFNSLGLVAVSIRYIFKINALF